MKFNLKNRPKWQDDEEVQANEKRDIIWNYNEWFEGFEKELRERLSNLELRELNPKCDRFSSAWAFAKEILGDYFCQHQK